MTTSIETRECKRCKGSGTTHREGFTSLGGTVYPAKTSECTGCEGEGYFTAPDIEWIMQRVTTGRGAKDGKRKLRAAWPGTEHYRNKAEARAYYCWRLARFHGGADVTMPMTATMVLRSDPFQPELDKVADALAVAAFGSDRRAALRWGRALGYEIPTQPDDNVMTQSGGPVTLDGTPEY